MSDGILEIVATGEITKNDLDRLRGEVLALIRKENAKAVLWSGRAMKGPTDIATAYFRARSVPLNVKVIPCAIVEPSQNKEFQSFYEATATNSGQLLKYFTDIEAARAWLKSIL